MKKEFSTPSIETRGLLTEGVMAIDLAIFAISSGQSVKRTGVEMTDTVTEGYNAWKGFTE